MAISNQKLETGSWTRKGRMATRVVFVVFLTGLLVPASATTLVRMSLEQLSQASTAIVRGRVASQESRWNDAHTQIVTLTTIAVGQRFKGQVSDTVVVEQLGGTVGNIRSRVAGVVRFHQGEDYVLFLEPAGVNPARHLVVGMMQGAYRIYRDATTNEERVIRPVSASAEHDQVDATEQAAPAAEPPAGAETVPFGRFREQLSAAMTVRLLIPSGTSIPLTVQSTEFEGVGRMRVVGRTTADLFPTPKTVIPAGSAIEGSAQRSQGGVWRIYWSEVSVRGTSIPISATSEESDGSLRGRSLLVRVR